MLEEVAVGGTRVEDVACFELDDVGVAWEEDDQSCDLEVLEAEDVSLRSEDVVVSLCLLVGLDERPWVEVDERCGSSEDEDACAILEEDKECPC